MNLNRRHFNKGGWSGTRVLRVGNIAICLTAVNSFADHHSVVMVGNKVDEGCDDRPGVDRVVTETVRNRAGLILATDLADDDQLRGTAASQGT